MRLVTINLWNHPWAWQERAAGAAVQLLEEHADVVCLQEVRFDAGTDSATLIAQQAGFPFVCATPHSQLQDGSWTGTAVLSRTPLQQAQFQFPAAGSTGGYVTLVRTEIDGVFTTIASVHLSWGAQNEVHRLTQARALDAFIKANVPESDVVLVAGDFNCEDDSDTIRFLTGKTVSEGQSTFWVDAWTSARGKRQENDAPSEWGATVAMGNTWAYRVALEHGLNPDLVPPRRIDYVLVRGWAYRDLDGVCGTNIVLDDDVVAVDGVEGPVSDHFGLRVDFTWQR